MLIPVISELASGFENHTVPKYQAPALTGWGFLLPKIRTICCTAIQSDIQSSLVKQLNNQREGNNMSKNTTKGLLSKAWPDEVLEANQELSKAIADDTDNALTLEERTQAHKERMQVHEANKDDPDFLINQWSDAITAGAIRADAVTNAALVINKMEVDAITAHRNIAGAGLITADTIDASPSLVSDTIYKSITQTNYRLPTSLIKQIEEAVTTLGAKNKTQAAITLIEKGLLISGLSASSKGKIFKVLMSDYQIFSPEEIYTITKITEGFKNEI